MQRVSKNSEKKQNGAKGKSDLCTFDVCVGRAYYVMDAVDKSCACPIFFSPCMAAWASRARTSTASRARRWTSHCVNSVTYVPPNCFFGIRVLQNSISVGVPPRPRWKNLRRSHRFPSRLGRGIPRPHPIPPSTPSASCSRLLCLWHRTFRNETLASLSTLPGYVLPSVCFSLTWEPKQIDVTKSPSLRWRSVNQVARRWTADGGAVAA